MTRLTKLRPRNKLYRFAERCDQLLRFIEETDLRIEAHREKLRHLSRFDAVGREQIENAIAAAKQARQEAQDELSMTLNSAIGR